MAMTPWPTSAPARRRVPHGLSFSVDAAALSWPCAWRTELPLSIFCNKLRLCPRQRNGRCSFAPRRTHAGNGDDEERDYMYRMYAHIHQARLNSGHSPPPARWSAMTASALSCCARCSFRCRDASHLLRGRIGMGENIYLGDRNGVRTPMQWSADKNAGFSRANPQSLYLPITWTRKTTMKPSMWRCRNRTGIRCYGGCGN